MGRAECGRVLSPESPFASGLFVAVVYVGEDLDVLLELCDRILVLCGGKANGMLDARTTTKEEVGLRMTNLVQKEGK